MEARTAGRNGPESQSGSLVAVDDALIEAVEAARQRGAMASAWRRARRDWTGEEAPPLKAKVLQTFYKPLERARLVVRIKTPRNSDPSRRKRRFLFVQFYADSATARRRSERARKGKSSLKGLGPPVFEIPEWSAVGWSIPNGPRLRILRTFLGRKPFERFLSQHDLPEAELPRVRLPRLLRYVPRRRAVLEWRPNPGEDGGAAYIKVYAPGVDVESARNMRLLANRGGASLLFRTPQLVLHDPRRRAVIMSGLPGRVLTEHMLAADVDVLPRVGRALASLHRAPLSPYGHHGPTEWLRDLRLASADLRRAVPGLKSGLRALGKELRGRAAALGDPEALAPIHANLFGDQVLVDGDRLGIVDWDDFTRGDPLYDLGRLIAHQLFLGIRASTPAAATRSCIGALVEAYAAGSGVRPAPERLAWHVASSLVVRAKISALRPLAPGWVEEVGGAVDEAGWILSGSSERYPSA